MSLLDPYEMLSTIKNRVTDVLDNDLSARQELYEQWLEAMALQASWVVEGTLHGRLNEEERNFFLTNLETMARDFSRFFVDLDASTLEKLWDAVVGALWRAIGEAINLVLPIPVFR